MKANETVVAGRRREFDEMGDGGVGSVGRTRSSGRARRESGNIEGFVAN